MTDPNCAVFRQALEREFADVLQFRSLTPNDKAHKLHGPYTEATVTLRQGAEPKLVQPFRCLGVQAAAFNAQGD